MLPSRSHQQPKPTAGAAGGNEKVDEPASEYALSGFNLYFLSEQSRPKSRTLAIVSTIFIFSIIGGFFCTARVVWVARRRRRSKVSDSDPEPPA